MSETDETMTETPAGVVDALLEDVPDDVWASAFQGALDAAPDAADDLADLLPDDAVGVADDGVLDVLEVAEDAFGEEAPSGTPDHGSPDGSSPDGSPDGSSDDAGDAGDADDTGLEQDVLEVLDVLEVDDPWSSAADDGAVPTDDPGHDHGSDL